MGPSSTAWWHLAADIADAGAPTAPQWTRTKTGSVRMQTGTEMRRGLGQLGRSDPRCLCAAVSPWEFDWRGLGVSCCVARGEARRTWGVQHQPPDPDLVSMDGGACGLFFRYLCFIITSPTHRQHHHHHYPNYHHQQPSPTPGFATAFAPTLAVQTPRGGARLHILYIACDMMRRGPGTPTRAPHWPRAMSPLRRAPPGQGPERAPRPLCGRTRRPACHSIPLASIAAAVWYRRPLPDAARRCSTMDSACSRRHWMSGAWPPAPNRQYGCISVADPQWMRPTDVIWHFHLPQYAV
ncbi:hypothetical protein T440DRAFT_27121 [Plenodomus tracheiphilus IPT5]|uniref:Uncharacterized protein n=1 Tax=Plenodomus tracheiphilus IPT5 TaxID=1408161 RepID=A0A6A7AMR3_9PLEO|nr:hypothetical protein T440DRAFT_27121 [Plenodomus tracheiphilus IPT5]